MKNGFEGLIAWRYLRARRKETFISLISVISLAGVALGVTALVIVLSVMNGFRADIRKRIIGTQAHVVIASYDQGKLDGWRAIASRVRAHPHVKAVSPYLAYQAMLKKEKHIQGAVIWGIDPEAESRVTRLKENLKSGRLEKLNQPPLPGPDRLRGRGIILGIELAHQLGVRTGDSVTVIAPVFKMTAAGTVPKVATFEVVGVFEAGMYEYDSTFAYLALDAARELFEQPDAVNGMAIRVDELENAGRVARDLQAGAVAYWARDFMALNRNLAVALEMEKLVMFIILIMIVLVAAFNIASTLIMVAMEKKKEIGILKAMGARSGSILKIFLFQGGLIGGAGTLLGVLGGLLACTLLKLFPLKIPGGGSVYYIERLPVDTQAMDVLAVVGLTLLVSALAALYPAWQASRLDPVEAIRYE